MNLEKIREIATQYPEAGDDLDLLVIAALEKDMGRHLDRGEKAEVRYLLDQDSTTRNAILHRHTYDADRMEDWR